MNSNFTLHSQSTKKEQNLRKNETCENKVRQYLDELVLGYDSFSQFD